MKLKEFLDSYKIHPVQIAFKSGVSLASMYVYLSGRGKPHLKTAKKISAATGGLVSVEELREKKEE